MINEESLQVDHEPVRGQERGLPGGDFNGEKCELSFSQWKVPFHKKLVFSEIQGSLVHDFESS